MSEHDAFLGAMRADPDNDTPRLIYADWLEERGDPRGKFIRVQCALADSTLDDECRQLLAKRERELLRAHAVPQPRRQ